MVVVGGMLGRRRKASRETCPAVRAGQESEPAYYRWGRSKRLTKRPGSINRSEGRQGRKVEV